MSFIVKIKKALNKRLKNFKFIIGYTYDYFNDNVPKTIKNSDGSTSIEIENHQRVHYRIANKIYEHFNDNYFKVVNANITVLINSYILLVFKKNYEAGTNKPLIYSFLNNRHEKSKKIDHFIEYAPTFIFLLFSTLFYFSLPSDSLPKPKLDNFLQNTNYIIRFLPFLGYLAVTVYASFKLTYKNRDIISSISLWLCGFVIISFLGTNFISQSFFQYLFIVSAFLFALFHLVITFIIQLLLVKKNNQIRSCIEIILDQNKYRDIQNVMNYIQNLINEKFNNYYEEASVPDPSFFDFGNKN